MFALSFAPGPLACLRPGSAPGGPGAPAPAPLTKLVAEGDSITASGDSYAQRWAADNPGVAFAKEAVGGSTLASMTARLAATMAEEPSHLTLMIGANDLMGAASAAAYASGIQAYVAAAKAIDAEVVVGVCGVLPVDEARLGGGYTGFNTRRNAVNALLRAAAGSGTDFYVPIGDAFADGDALDTGLCPDGLHWTSLAYDRMEAVYAAVLDPVLGEAAGSVPSAFSFTDAVNATAEAVYRSTIHVTGMGLNRTATASLTGDGEFARGAGGFGTSPITTMNGDAITARVEAGADPEDAVSATVTIGGVSDTFTVTTAPDEADAVNLTAGNSQFRSLGYAASSYTFGTNGDQLSFPADGLHCVAIACDNRYITAVTIGSVAATRAAGMAVAQGVANRDVCIWAVAGTAGNKDAAVTANGNTNLLLVQSFVLENAGVATAAGTKNDGSAASHNVGQIEVASGGLAVAIAANRFGGAGNYNWTGAAEFFDANGAGNAMQMGGASIIATGTPVAAYSVGATSNTMMCSAAWEAA